MSEIRIYPDIPPKGTYDPVDDVIKSAQQIPGFVEVIKNQYYREWDITFVFDDQVITKRDAQRKIDNLHKAFRDKWGQPMTDTTTPRAVSGVRGDGRVR